MFGKGIERIGPSQSCGSQSISQRPWEVTELLEGTLQPLDISEFINLSQSMDMQGSAEVFFSVTKWSSDPDGFRITGTKF